MEPTEGNSHASLLTWNHKKLAPLFTKCDNKATGSKEKTIAEPFLGKWPR
jgi:hypothetical protein